MNTANTELRKLSADFLSSVEEILETNEDWKRFMSIIPKNLENLDNEHYEYKYNGEDIRLVENYSKKTKEKGAKVLFAEWGTSGRVRPTLKTLQKILVKALMFKAADTIAIMLGEPLPERPTKGPAAPINIHVTDLLDNDSVTQQLYTTSEHCNAPTRQMESINLIQFPTTKSIQNQSAEQTSANNMIHNTSESQYIPVSVILNPKPNEIPTNSFVSDSEISQSYSLATESTPMESKQQSIFHEQTDIDILEDDNLIQFSFKDLTAVTNNFSDANCIGKGGFGDVFAGTHYSLGMLAVKKVHEKLSSDLITKMFNNEVKLLSLLRHANIVPILGFSLDGPVRCIVCKYIDGGTLKQKIAIKGDKGLSKTQRINIMIGTAEGLRYIHNTVKPDQNAIPSAWNTYFIHGDVKSSNILLTKDCFPKLCDFGLAKQFDTTYITSNIVGTRAYMAPESISGTITQKSDVYSYGMVLLELLTGLEPLVQHYNASMNIKDYLKDGLSSVDGDITSFLDKDVGEWVEAQSIYDIAKLCLNNEKTQRPSMDDICTELVNIQKTAY